MSIPMRVCTEDILSIVFLSYQFDSKDSNPILVAFYATIDI